MSLINQVLRDLDKRLAGASTPSAAVKAPRATAAPSAWRRVGRWAAGITFTTAAVVAGGMAQGSIDWPGRTAVKPQATPMAVAAPAAAPAAPASAVAQTVAATQISASAPVPAPALVLTMAMLVPQVPFAAGHETAEPKVQKIHAAALNAAASAPRAEARIAKQSSASTPQERAVAQYQRGVTAHQAGQIDESANAFAAALREDPAFAPARLAQAGVLIAQSRPDEAHALLQEGLAATPQQPTLALMLARLQTERQDLAAAAETLKAASAKATGNAEYLGFYGAILQRANRHAEAAEQFNAALRLAPTHSVWWMGLGISLAASGQNGAAREAFTRAKAIGALPPDAGQYVELRLRQLM